MRSMMSSTEIKMVPLSRKVKLQLSWKPQLQARRKQRVSAEQEKHRDFTDPLRAKDQGTTRIPGPPPQQRPSEEAVFSARERFLARKKQCGS